MHKCLIVGPSYSFSRTGNSACDVEGLEDSIGLGALVMSIKYYAEFFVFGLLGIVPTEIQSHCKGFTTFGNSFEVHRLSYNNNADYCNP
jgi:hypothetical protein